MKRILGQIFGLGGAARAAAPKVRRVDLGERSPAFPIYAIGDVHGCLDLLLNAEQKIAADMERNKTPGLIVMLGDYIDRGPNSSAVLEHLCQAPMEGTRRILLRGNHEAAFLQFVEAPLQNLQWLEFGGRQTLLSYGIDVKHYLTREARKQRRLETTLNTFIPEAHLALIRSMPIYLRFGKYLFVHAGVRPSIPLESQLDEDLLWIREPFLSSGPDLPYFVIHGHSPVPEPQVGASRICIDTGAVASGRLTVLKIQNESASVLS